MTKERFKGLCLLWIIVVIIELAWLYAATSSVVIVGRVIFIITLIATTLAIGSLGLYLISKNPRNFE